MKFLYLVAICLLAFGLTPSGQRAFAGEAQNHIGHVMDRWDGAPGHQGLLPAAEIEAEIARTHARLATSKPDDLASIKAHIGHVLHAMDPEAEAQGPGRGFGALRAAAAVIAHVSLAEESSDASDVVKLHSPHVRTSADNVVAWSRRIIELGRRAQETDDATTAFALASEVHALTGYILDGSDANGDGRISWQAGEGGLKQARTHMNFMKGGAGSM